MPLRGAISVLRCPAVLAVERSVAATAAMVTAYYVLPNRLEPRGAALLMSAAVLGGPVVLVGWQAQFIRRARHARVRALETFALVVPAFLLSFATVYFHLEHHAARSFSQRLDRTDALYFTVSVFSSSGFCDIVPRSTTARLIVTVQMMGDLALLGAAARLVMDALSAELHSRHNRHRRRS